MSHLNETRQSTFPGEMLSLEHFPLIPVDEQDTFNIETWLYILKVRENKVAFVEVSSNQFSTLNSTINLKDTSQWLDSLIPGEILLKEGTENILENEQTKIIDTRTFTRPRKNRLSSSPLRPISQTTHPVEIECTNLNSTFNYKAEQNGPEMLNATVVIEESNVKEAELNATFPVGEIMNGSPEAELSPCNNNVYPLNSTFPTQLVLNSTFPTQVVVETQMPVKSIMNATYSEEEPVQGPNAAREYSLDEMEELEEEDRIDEALFLKPLLPGAVPKKTLIRTSTLNNESPKKNISPPVEYGLRDIEKIAKLQEESLTQTSTPMGQRRFSGFRRPAEVDHNLGSPISNPAHGATGLDGTINLGPPIPISVSLASNANSDSMLDNSNHAVQGQLTFEKSHNSVEVQSSSPSSPAGSPYSSQSLESDAGPPTAQDMIRRSMPNLNNSSRLRLPQPSVVSGNLNRLHGSDTGLRPPSTTGIRPPVGSVMNGTLIRPQLPQPQSYQVPPPSAVAESVTKPSQPPRSMMPPPRNSLLPASSRLKQPQLVAPRVTSALPARTLPVADDLNSTVVVEKPVVLPTAPPPPVLSGIPRPSMSRIPGPRTTLKSSIPTMAARPRGTH